MRGESGGRLEGRLITKAKQGSKCASFPPSPTSLINQRVLAALNRRLVCISSPAPRPQQERDSLNSSQNVKVSPDVVGEACRQAGDIFSLKHESSIFRSVIQPGPLCGFSMTEQVRLCTVCPMENWLGTSKTTYRVGTVGETNLYDKKFIPRGLTAFSGHTRFGLHGNYQISPF